jgi:hypothetical protein
MMNRHAEGARAARARALAASPGNADTGLIGACRIVASSLDKAVAASRTRSDRSEPRGARRMVPDGVRGHGGAGAAVPERFEAVRSRP